MHLARWQAPDPQRDRLQALVLIRRDMVAQRQACINRLEAPGAEPVEVHLTALLKFLENRIEAIDREIDDVIAQHEPLRRAAKILTAMAGVGSKTAAALLALMPELGQLDRRQVAALRRLGASPPTKRSHRGLPTNRGGRPEVKRVLFMAALSAARHNEKLRTVYQRLLANGKCKLVALTAVMRNSSLSLTPS